MLWLLQFLGFMQIVIGQQQSEQIILTQNGPMSYIPTLQNSPHGYYRADIFLVDIQGEHNSTKKRTPLPGSSTTLDIPVISEFNVKQPATLPNNKAANIPSNFQRVYPKKSTDLNKNPHYKKTKRKIISRIPKQILQVNSNKMEPNGIVNGEYGARRFVNRGLHTRQSENILKGQAIDYHRSTDFETYVSPMRGKQLKHKKRKPKRPHYIIKGRPQAMAHGKKYYFPSLTNHSRSSLYRNTIRY